MTEDTDYFCPKCGAKSLGSTNLHQFHCADCRFQIFHNVAATVSIVLKYDNEFLFSKRGRNPAKGLLDFPGGFVDPDESLEQALMRELKEELNWQPENFQYLFSFPNTYLYADVVYRTADAFFLCAVEEKPLLTANDDVESLVWKKVETLEPASLAFESMRQAVEILRRGVVVTS